MAKVTSIESVIAEASKKQHGRAPLRKEHSDPNWFENSILRSNDGAHLFGLATRGWHQAPAHMSHACDES